MGLFGSYKPKVSKQEFKKVRSALVSKGLSKREINTVESVFMGSLHERQASEQGIDTKEIERGVQYMKSNKNKLNLSSNDIDKIEKSLKDKL